ncbi:MAG: hypothetical protein ACRDE2_17915, partial [Chitinophagaceae bacterium]
LYASQTNNIVASKKLNKSKNYPRMPAAYPQPPVAYQHITAQYLQILPNDDVKAGNIELPSATGLSGSYQNIPDTVSYTGTEAMKINSSSLPKHTKTDGLKKPHWYLGITGGPDLSSASGEGWGTGISGGLTLNYQLNKKWIFETGISVAKAIYTAAPYDYHPPDNPYSYYNIQSIDANCLLIDLPLNVDYVIWNNEKHVIYAGMGLSSTWMHHETYTYNIKTNTGAWEQYQQEMYNKEHQLFSLLNISAGYERTWSHFSLGVAPYVKIPLSGIGYGRVKLLSTGIQFSLKYGLK